MTVRTKLFFALLLVLLLAAVGCLSGVLCTEETVTVQAPARETPLLTIEPTVTPAVTPAPSPSPTPVPIPFTLAWITDTQTLTMYESIGKAIVPMFRWVEESRGEYNTVALIHTGDLVENGANPKYWDRIHLGIDEIGTDLPLIPAAGNHDVAKSNTGYAVWRTQPFFARLAPERQYREGEGYYEVIEVGGESLVIVALGYLSCDEEGMAWARGVFDAHADSVGILAVHSYLSKSPYTSAIWTREGKRLREGVVDPCNNVRLVLCGHVHGTAIHEEWFDDDADGNAERLVTALRHNEQDRDTVGQVGWLRMLTFDPITRDLNVMTYSPFLDKHYTSKSREAEENFTLHNAF